MTRRHCSNFCTKYLFEMLRSERFKSNAKLTPYTKCRKFTSNRTLSNASKFPRILAHFNVDFQSKDLHSNIHKKIRQNCEIGVVKKTFQATNTSFFKRSVSLENFFINNSKTCTCSLASKTFQSERAGNNSERWMMWILD